jgi:hypothetical protein
MSKKAYLAQWYREAKRKDPQLVQRMSLWGKFKRTPEWYEQKLAEQGSHCALCPATSSGPLRMHVDHDHACCPSRVRRVQTCGECIRGILCNPCNHRLSFLEQTLLESAVLPDPGSWTANALAYLSNYETLK